MDMDAYNERRQKTLVKLGALGFYVEGRDSKLVCDGVTITQEELIWATANFTKDLTALQIIYEAGIRNGVERKRQEVKDALQKLTA